MRKCVKNMMSVVSVVALSAFIFSGYRMTVSGAIVSGHQLNNPVTENSNTQWDCIWYGSYPQAEVVPNTSYSGVSQDLMQDGDIIKSDELYKELTQLKNMDWGTDGNVRLNGEYYKRIKKSDATTSTLVNNGPLGKSVIGYNWSDDSTYHYFKYEPIKWRILKVDGDNVLALAEKGLDNPSATKNIKFWNESDTRMWLNGTGGGQFINQAFTSEEQAIINDTQITENGSTVTDKVFLLSKEEAISSKYGFNIDSSKPDSSRWCQSSTYAKAMGVCINNEFKSIPYYGCSPWMLRSAIHDPASRSGPANYKQTVVGSMGNIVNSLADYTGTAFGCNGVRPAVNIHISQGTTVCIYAGTVNNRY